MLGLGPMELVVILVLVMLVFGVGKLPDVGAGLGRGMREFKDGISGRSDEDERPALEKELDRHPE